MAQPDNKRVQNDSRVLATTQGSLKSPIKYGGSEKKLTYLRFKILETEITKI